MIIVAPFAERECDIPPGEKLKTKVYKMKKDPFNRMFTFINETWNPIAGGSSVEDGEVFACSFKCKYCWARSLIHKFRKGNLGKKYSGPFRIHERTENRKFKPGDFVAVQFMSDIGDPAIPSSVICSVLDSIRDNPEVKYLLLTKSDQFYIEYIDEIPNNCICGITVETDKEIPPDISLAPNIQKRIDSLVWLKSNYPSMRTFVSIEPIMDFTFELIPKILKVEPWAVAIGYDNYKNQLPEPSEYKTECLYRELSRFTKVYRKTIRKKWDRVN
jgi:protein gp37